VGWVWTAVVVWVLLAVPAAVALGRVINRAERREIGTPAPDTPIAPAETHPDRT
jgi:predicted membrane-bound mannosyltransferase